MLGLVIVVSGVCGVGGFVSVVVGVVYAGSLMKRLVMVDVIHCCLGSVDGV